MLLREIRFFRSVFYCERFWKKEKKRKIDNSAPHSLVAGGAIGI